MKQVEPITTSQRQTVTSFDAQLVTKLNELIQAHNELLAKYEGHTHAFTSPEASQILSWEQSVTEPAEPQHD